MNNVQLAKVFTNIADLLEIKGEVIYKIRAYRKAAESLESLGREAALFHQEGKLEEIPGVGSAISEKIAELLESGQLEFLNKLTSEYPLSLTEMLAVPDMGPKKVGQLYKSLGIQTVSELEVAAKEGKLRDLPGFGEKSESKILAGIESLKRRSGRLLLGDVLPVAEKLLTQLREVPGVVHAEAAGSLRRRRATIGDLDILVAATDAEAVLTAFTALPEVDTLVSRGTVKASVVFTSGLRAQVWVHPPERFGTALQYATGSKDHNVKLREIALTKGLSLSEHALTHQDGNEILCETEKQVYAQLDLPYIPPELREDHGEVQAAQKNQLPNLITQEDIRAELHSHSTWSDGAATIREMAQRAVDSGYKVLAITDHSHSLGITRGMNPERIVERLEEIKQVREEYDGRLILLSGAEVEIRADGSLDYEDNVLASLDLVIASLHVSLRQPRAQITERLLNAINNPHVDIIGHPTGRLLPDREGADLDMEVILNAAAKAGIALEINANPHRLDLEDIYARRAKDLGIPITINTDAHHPDHMSFISYGISIARRGWLESENVINTWAPEKLLAWLAKRHPHLDT